MALTDSNTYTEPTAGTSLNASRTQYNNSMRSLLTNFRSSSPPDTVNIVASGSPIDVPDGTLFASTETNALYISDSISKKSSPVGGNFTRNGIGHRNENGIVAMMANADNYEIGELATTVSSGALAGNARLYLVTANNRTAADFIDVGIPPTNGSIVNTMIAINGITTDRVNLTGGKVTTAGLRVNDLATGGGKTWYPEAGAVGNAQLQISGVSSTANSAILFNYSSSASNVSLAHEPGQTAVARTGLAVIKQDGTYTAMAANIVLSSAIQGSGTVPVPLLPAGSIVVTGGAVPAGWLECDGQTISRSTYAALFAAIGTAYGAGDGSSTFLVPNFGSKVLIGESSDFAMGPGAATFVSGGTITTASGSASLTTGTTTASTGGKDAGSVTVLNAASVGGHTHTAVVPHAVARYMVKT
jgi:microcystin-dependent protein|tara:strand:+ start:2834 stop:4081 length:1248 start_codon:yes stop_codon:yes gene_type:complete